MQGRGERPLEELALCVHLALESGPPLERYPDWVHAAVRDALAAEAVRDGAVAARLDEAVAATVAAGR